MAKRQKKEEMTSMPIRIPAEDVTRLFRISIAQGRSLASQVRMYIKQGLEKDKVK